MKYRPQIKTLDLKLSNTQTYKRVDEMGGKKSRRRNAESSLQHERPPDYHFDTEWETIAIRNTMAYATFLLFHFRTNKLLNLIARGRL